LFPMVVGMYKKIIYKIIVFSLVFVTNPVQAISLGDIKLLSHLSQPLHAEIEVPAIRHEDEASLDISLGSRDLYTRSGIEYPPVLQDVILKLKWREDGSAYILLRTDRPLKELALSFFVELSWSGGRMLRQYDILLEPTGMQGAIRHSLEGETVVQVERVREPEQVAPQVADRSLKSLRPASNLAARFEGGEVEYGPIRPGESLSRIAQRMRPDPAMSLEQMMLAIFRENKHAFLNNSMNSLSAGVTLHIRKPEMITSISHEQAEKLVDIHTAPWSNQRIEMASREVQSVDPLFEPPAVNETDSANSGRIQRGGNSGRLVLSEPVLPDLQLETIPDVDVSKLSKLEQEVHADRIQKQIIATREAAQAVEARNVELRERMQRLQGQIAKLQTNLQDIDAQEQALRQQAKHKPLDEQQMVRLLAPDTLDDNMLLDDFMPLQVDNTFAAGASDRMDRLDSQPGQPVFIAESGSQEKETLMVAAVSGSILAAPPKSINRNGPKFIDDPLPGSGEGSMMTTLSGVSLLSLALFGFVVRYRREQLDQWLQQLKLRFGKNKTDLPF